MGDASYVQTSFLGGERAPTAQGRIDLPDYRTAMNVCLNGLPLEAGAWTRRPGTRLGGATRDGAPGRLISFDFTASAPYNIEFTDGHLRFWNGYNIVTTGDDQTVSAISTANPAKVTTGTHGWATGDRGFFKNLGVNNPLLHNRRFIFTVTSATQFTLQDALTGSNIDGSTLGTFVSGTVSRIKDIVSPYASGQWANTRLVQATLQVANGAEVDGVLLHNAVPSQALKVVTAPTASAFATFSLAPIFFMDGPYFDPVPGGTLATPSGLTGVVNLTLSYGAYDATKAYKIGDYVTYSSVNYKSLTDANLGNQPDTHATNWGVTTSFDAISATGFQGSDIGRHVRIYSEPALWVSGTSYVAGNIVAVSNGIGGTAYYTCLTNNTASATNAPGISLTTWAVNARGARWTWGKISSLLNEIDRALAGSANLGDMTANTTTAYGHFGVGIAAASDGLTNQTGAAGASSNAGSGSGQSAYIGKNYSGASAQAISSATFFPSSDYGLAPVFGAGSFLTATLNLRAKATLPASASDGTLLGTTGSLTTNPTGPITITSSDTVTTWNYVWFEIIVTYTNSGTALNFILAAEVKFFGPVNSGTSNGVAVQLLGDPLLYTTAIRTWRLGLFSATTGYPSAGTFHEGRLWLTGIVGNRIDASRSGDPYNMAPTEPDGTVSGSNAISYTFNAPDINPIYWMKPDDQGIICGTKAGEWLVRATTNNEPLTPTNIQAHRVTKIGCANVEPRHTEHTTVFVQKYMHKVMEYFADIFSGKFSAPNLTENSKHLTADDVVEIAYQQELTPTVWGRTGAGKLIGWVYKRQSLMSSQGPTFSAAHRHALGSGRTVESICVGPNQDGTLDSLSMVTSDGTYRYVELMTDIFNENRTLLDAWFVDSGVVPSAMVLGTIDLKIYGLWLLNGQTVTVWGNGQDYGDYVVASGAITIPLQGTFTSAVAATLTTTNTIVGFTYNSDGQVVRPATQVESGTRNGPGLFKTKRTHWLGVLLDKTQGISFGTGFAAGQLNDAQLKTPGGSALLPRTTLFSDIYWKELTDGPSLHSMLSWRVSRPYPATVVAIGGFVHTEDK